MATWHQLRSTVRLYHDMDWTVVEDPHHGCRTLTTFRARGDANAYLARVRQLRPDVPAYILKPARISAE